MNTLLISLALANLFIGFVVGGTGIGGFLLPVMLTALMGFPVRSSLTLSFIAFTVAGLSGAYFFYKANNLDVRKALVLSLGSIPGAWAGVLLNKLMPVRAVSLVLYSFILTSSLYTLWNVKNKSRQSKRVRATPQPSISPAKLIIVGALSAAFCAFAGAGGPILVIPILTLLGLDPKQGVGIALLNSVFIGVVASLGYSMELGQDLLFFGSTEVVAVTIGAMLGAKVFHGMEAKKFSVLIALTAGSSSLFLLLKTIFV